MSEQQNGYRKRWGISFAALLAAVAVWALLRNGEGSPDSAGLPSSSPIPSASPTAASTSVVYKPADLHPGDRVGGLTVESVRIDTAGQQSASVIFNGRLEVQGTFAYNSPLSGYNPEEVVFVPAPASAALMPKADTMADEPVRFRLTFRNESDKALFGTPGSTGTAGLALSCYRAVSAPVLDGTPNSGCVDEVRMNAVTPPAELSSDELTGYLRPIAPLPRSAVEPNGSPDPAVVTDWIRSVNERFTLPLAEKRVSDLQRQQISVWLNGAFTSPRAEGLTERFLIPAGDGVMLAGGITSLLPPGPIRSTADASLVQKDSDGKNWTYSVTFLLSGTQDAYFTCILQEEQGRMKIADWSIEYR